jgi:hypothetical protein
MRWPSSVGVVDRIMRFPFQAMGLRGKPPTAP